MGFTYLPCHYRPISTTCVTDKLMESISKEHIVAHLYNQTYIKTAEWFPGKTFYNYTAFECCRDWNVCMKSNKPVDVIYLDFAKAFDSVCTYKIALQIKVIWYE